MDNDKLKQFLFPLILLIITLVGSVIFFPQMTSNFQGWRTQKTENDNKLNEIEDKKAQLETLKQKAAAEAAKEKKNASKGKPFYRPIMSGMDTEAVVAGEFAEILQLIRANRIKVRSIKYDYDPADDAFVKGAPEKYNVARLNMEMIGNYANYSNFLKEIYKHEHFLDIQSVEVIPYKKNKKILLINLKLKLYAKK